MIIARPIGVCSPLPIVKDPNGAGIDASSITSGTIDAARMYVAIDTYANIVANHASAPEGSQAWAVDLDIAVRKNAAGLWRPVQRVIEFGGADLYMLIGGSGATWSRDSAGLITVTWTAHGLTAEYNGATCHLTQGTLSTGTANITTGWGFTNFQYVDANTFTVQSAELSSATGSLGSNTSETFLPTLYAPPANLLQRGDAIAVNALGYARCKSNANNKTIKGYFGDVLDTTTTITTNTVWTGVANAAIVMEGVLSFRITGRATTTVQTTAEITHKQSVNLANAGDWYCFMNARTQYQFHS